MRSSAVHGPQSTASLPSVWRIHREHELWRSAASSPPARDWKSLRGMAALWRAATTMARLKPPASRAAAEKPPPRASGPIPRPGSGAFRPRFTIIQTRASPRLLAIGYCLLLSTCKCWTFQAREFLRAQFKPRGAGLDCSTLNAQSFLDYFRKQSQSYGPPRLQAMGCALRSLCRFLCLGRCHPEGLSASFTPRWAARARRHVATFIDFRRLRPLIC
jgi:hypothetical protein